jgi:hypothetical protein
MPITDFFKAGKYKEDLQKTQQEIDVLKSTIAEMGQMDAVALKAAITDLEARKSLAEQEALKAEQEVAWKRDNLKGQIAELERQIAAKKQTLVILDEEMLLQEFALYRPKYGLESSEAYKVKLEHIQNQQADLVKAGKAAFATSNWTVNNSQKEGEKMTKDMVKLILRAFNNECDAGISAVKFSNVASIEKRIQKSYESLNALGQRMHITISTQYLTLRLAELYLCYEYQVKKQEEKEEQKRLREQMREEAKLMREIEEAKLKIEKEEKHFLKALASVEKQLSKVILDAERELLEKEKAEIIKNLSQVEQNKLDVLKREQNTRAGYVYIISNIGSFGENVYKIGVTRRLDPQERIDELGDASVPFDFDIHALIFSDNAPALENALHKAFADRRLNMINQRREFFRANLDEIEKVIKTNFSKPFELNQLADAPEYRQSLVLQKDRITN